jgi:hypothetical protein
MTSSLHKNKKSRKTVKITRPKITFVPLVNAKLAKQNRIPVFAPEPEVPHSHKPIEKVNVASSSKLDNSLLPMSSSTLSLGLDHPVSATELARRVFDQDDSVYPDLEHIVEWIGNGKPFSNLILTAYMDLYDFSNEKLETSFRILCLKLHLKGETQQIDRVLSRFATRYYQCNPKCIFGTAGKKEKRKKSKKKMFILKGTNFFFKNKYTLCIL